LSEHALRDRAVESFHYPAMQQAGSPELLGFGTSEAYRSRDLAVQQELAASVEAARKKGFQEGQAAASAAAAQMIEQERLAVTAAVGDFGQQRAEYFRHVETETVQLALSIARKVLHREAQMDPLLLAGVVRVALDQMQAGTRLVLRTSPASARIWAEFCSQHLQKEHTIEVVPDSTLEGHRCILQAEVGSTEISLDAQLHEIESGFFDLLQAKTENSR
jgi:flagellar assembly protein FliH